MIRVGEERIKFTFVSSAMAKDRQLIAKHCSHYETTVNCYCVIAVVDIACTESILVILHYHRLQKEVPWDIELMADTTFFDFSEIQIGAGASQADALLFVRRHTR